MIVEAEELPGRFAAVTERLGFQLHWTDVRAMAALARLLAGVGMTPARATALAYVADHEGCDQIALGRMLGINRASTMKLVDALVAVQAVERRTGRDRRSNGLYLGGRGRALGDAVQALIAGHERRLLASLTSAEQQMLRQLLDKLRTIDWDGPSARGYDND